MVPFNLLRAWHAEHPQTQPRLPEYIEAVDYNLQAAEAAKAVLRPEQVPALYHLVNGKVVLLRHDLDAIIRAGDSAVHRAIAALELTLQVINYVAGVNHPKASVDWRLDGRGKRDFRSALSHHRSGHGALVGTLDQIFESHQYRLFKDYRNWTAHRGAPKVLSTWRLGSVLPILDLPPGTELLNEAIVSEANERLFRDCRVLSLPFVPSVRAYVDDERGERPSRGGPGISVPGDSAIRFRDNYVVVGGPLSDEASYVASNPVELGAGMIELAGEKLRVYSASTYAFAVSLAIMFVTECIAGPLDRALTAACEGAA